MRLAIAWQRASVVLSLSFAVAGCGHSSGHGGAADMAPGSTDPGDGGSTPGDDGGQGGTVTPTVSSWLGTNVAADLPRVDVTYQLNPFDTAAAMKDANGYPLAGVNGTSSTDIGFVLPSRTYKISYKGSGQLAVSGIGKLVGAWQSVNGEQRAAVQITGTPGAFGNFLTLAVTNGAGQSVTDVHLYMPGYDYDATQIFLPEFLHLLAPFKAMRFMEWENTNGSTLANWSDRPAASSFGASPFGAPWEHIAALVNQTGKDAWITIPEHATDDFVHQLGAFLAAHLDYGAIAAARAAAGDTTPFQLLVEASNETWNGGFTAYKTFLAAANANPTRYTGTYTGTYGPSWMTSNSDLMKVGQYEADRLVQIATILRQELGAHADALAPVLSGWALGAGYSDDGLLFIKSNYGDPKQYISYVATAPYFGPADDTTTGALDTLFGAITTNVQSMDATYADFAKLVAQYGIKMAAYEGGQGLSGATNQTIKHLAQHDVRMHDAYVSYFALWKKHFGPSLFMHFDLAGTPGLPDNIYQYGYWGSIIGVLEDTTACGASLPMLAGTETIASVVHHCPKYQALREQVP